MVDETSRSTVERAAVALVIFILSGLMAWAGYKLTEVSENQVAADTRSIEQMNAVLFRVARIEGSLTNQYTEKMADREHNRIWEAVNHNWKVIQGLQRRLNDDRK